MPQRSRSRRLPSWLDLRAPHNPIHAFTSVGRTGCRAALWLGILGSLVSACATTGSPTSESAVQSWDLETDHETAWRAALGSIQELGFEVERLEEQGMLLTAWRSLTSDGGSSECGDRYWGQVEVRLSDVGDRVRLWILPEFHRGAAAQDLAAPRCRTNGRLERELSRLVIGRVAQAGATPRDAR